MRAHQAAAVRLALVVGGAPSDAEDIAQEAFVRAHAALPRYQVARAPFRTWLLAIVANQARDHRRAGGRRHRYELALAVDRTTAPPPSTADGSPDTATAAADAAERAALLAAVRALPERQRDVVGCRYLLELSEAETAAVLGLSGGTVKSHLSRGLARLRADLASGADRG